MRLPRILVFQQFADPGLERSYRHDQRGRQARFTLTLVYLAVTGIIVYWAVNFTILDTASAFGVVIDQALFVPILLVFAWLLGRPYYADAWWIDIALFVLIQPSLLNSIDTMVSTQAMGWPFNAQLCYGLMTAMAFACLVFSAMVVPFLYLTIASVAYLAIVLVVRDYPPETITYTIQNYAFFAVIVFFLNVAIDRKARATFFAQTRLAHEQAKSEALLGNMLPAPIAERLKSREAVADGFADIVVVFVDLVGFTTLSQQLGPARIVELLNAFFSRADRGTDLFGLEKVKTIGDAYMAVVGAMTKPPRPAKAALDFAVWLRGEAREVGRGFEVDLRLHVGIARGPAIGGVISAKRLSYDYWGHTVNLAARLQDSATADGIAVSEYVWQDVRDSYPFGDPREIQLKGVGPTPVFDLALAADG